MGAAPLRQLLATKTEAVSDREVIAIEILWGVRDGMQTTIGGPLRTAEEHSGDQTSKDDKLLQKEKYAEIIVLLVSAGYFRARISALSEFDKVIGGLCWCITLSGAALDVDILFQEDMSTGQKIRLSEKIVQATRGMGCPHSLQAHQIQGSDWNNVQASRGAGAGCGSSRR